MCDYDDLRLAKVWICIQIEAPFISIGFQHILAFLNIMCL